MFKVDNAETFFEAESEFQLSTKNMYYIANTKPVN